MFLSQNAGNRLAYGTDNGVFVSSELPPRENQGGSFLVLNQNQTLEWAKPVVVIVPGHIRNVPFQIFSPGSIGGDQ